MSIGIGKLTDRITVFSDIFDRNVEGRLGLFCKVVAKNFEIHCCLVPIFQHIYAKMLVTYLQDLNLFWHYILLQYSRVLFDWLTLDQNNRSRGPIEGLFHLIFLKKWLKIREMVSLKFFLIAYYCRNNNNSKVSK